MLILREKDLAVLCKIIKESFPDSFQVWTYGSRVDGTAHDASDLDLVIRSADLSPIDFDIMEGFRESLRNSNIPVLIEARDWARVPEHFRSRILECHEVVCYT